MKAQLSKLVVEVIKKEEVLTPTEAKATAKGIIVSKGPACECEAIEGDTVLFSSFAGSRFEHDDKEYLVLNQAELFVKL